MLVCLVFLVQLEAEETRVPKEGQAPLVQREKRVMVADEVKMELQV